MNDLNLLKAQHQHRINQLVNQMVELPTQDREIYSIQLADALYEIKHLLIDIYEIKQSQFLAEKIMEDLEL